VEAQRERVRLEALANLSSHRNPRGRRMTQAA